MSERLRARAFDGPLRRTFVDAVLAGEAAWSDMDRWVARWHGEATHLSLHEWLGLSFEEYALLGGGDWHLATILYARRHEIPLDAARIWFEREAVSTRGHGDDEALQRLLVREGLVRS